jgi:hypothetical protein
MGPKEQEPTGDFKDSLCSVDGNVVESKTQRSISPYHNLNYKKVFKKSSTNMIKFTEHNIMLDISIVDTGAGISADGIKNLFVDYNKLSENEHMN